MREPTLQEIVGIFEEVVDLSGAEVQEQSVLGEDIPVDSREMLRVLSRIESRYRIRFIPQEIMEMKTLKDLMVAIGRHMVIG